MYILNEFNETPEVEVGWLHRFQFDLLRRTEEYIVIVQGEIKSGARGRHIEALHNAYQQEAGLQESLGITGCNTGSTP